MFGIPIKACVVAVLAATLAAIPPFAARAEHEPLIYVANAGGGHNDAGSIGAFGLRDDGNVAPHALLSGPRTGIGNPNNVAADPAGALFTLIPRSGKVVIAVFGPGANGDALPSRVIENAHLNHVMVLLCADTAGYVYALYREGPHLERHGIDVFAPGASGTVEPVRTIAGSKTLLSQRASIVQLFVDLRGNVWWYGNGETGPRRIVGYAAGANGNVAPMRAIEKRSFPQVPTSFVVDAQGTVYASAPLEVLVYPPGANGAVQPARRMQPDCLPYCNVADIVGRDLVFVGMLLEKTPAISTYEALGSGHLRPVRQISGDRTHLVNPVWLASTP